jgi:hypothetical protein
VDFDLAKAMEPKAVMQTTGGKNNRLWDRNVPDANDPV